MQPGDIIKEPKLLVKKGYCYWMLKQKRQCYMGLKRGVGWIENT